MVLDLLFKAEEIETHPVEMFLYSAFVTLIASIISLIVFTQYASITLTFIISMTLLPVMHKLLLFQERTNEMKFNLPFHERYRNILQIYGMFFLGVVFSTLFMFSFYPSDALKSLFEEQISTINAIRNDNLGIEGYVYNRFADFVDITGNNLKVLFIAFLMSFFFGTGALFILSWNATIVGTFIALYARELSDAYEKHILLAHIESFLSISLHGIPEIMAYFLGGIAGGILSYGLIEGNNRKLILRDSFTVFALASFMIIVAGFIEVYISASL